MRTDLRNIARQNPVASSQMPEKTATGWGRWRTVYTLSIQNVCRYHRDSGLFAVSTT